ncbi:MAG: glycosyltransferase family 9 protein [Ignavibacteriae bacterium]|nr:glycosyltransferase family 9 protein [Ignavibacteriota bacterium]
MLKFRRILIVRTDRIGDVILTLPMAHVLKKQFPSVHIAMLIQRYTEELVEDNPMVDQILFYDDGEKPLPFFHLVASLRAQRFDIVFHTHPRFRVALITWIAGIPVRVGSGYRWYSFLFNKKMFEHRKDAQRSELQYNLNLLTAIDCSYDSMDITPVLEVKPQVLDKVRALLTNLGIQKTHRLVIIHPGSGGSARDWSARNFGLLGKRLSEIPRVKIFITGGKNEDNIVSEVQDIVGKNAVTILNQLNLRECAALAKLSSLFIANSTGPLHIAAAVGTPVVGLYSHVTPMSAARWGPYTEKKTILSPHNKPIDCRKCLGKQSGGCECMDSITVDEVYQAALTYLIEKQPKAIAS